MRRGWSHYEMTQQKKLIWQIYILSTRVWFAFLNKAFSASWVCCGFCHCRIYSKNRHPRISAAHYEINTIITAPTSNKRCTPQQQRRAYTKHLSSLISVETVMEIVISTCCCCCYCRCCCCCCCDSFQLKKRTTLFIQKCFRRFK